jgi:hypothetical protein
MYDYHGLISIGERMPDCLSSAFSLVALSLVAFPITASSVVFLSGTSSADQPFLSFLTFNGYFELTTAARNFYF